MELNWTIKKSYLRSLATLFSSCLSRKTCQILIQTIWYSLVIFFCLSFNFVINLCLCLFSTICIVNRCPSEKLTYKKILVIRKFRCCCCTLLLGFMYSAEELYKFIESYFSTMKRIYYTFKSINCTWEIGLEYTTQKSISKLEQ